MQDLFDDFSESERASNLKIEKNLIGLELIEEWDCCREYFREYSTLLLHVETDTYHSR